MPEALMPKKKTTPRRKMTSEVKERHTVAQKPRYARVLVRYSFRTSRKSKAEMRIMVDAELRGRAMVVEMQEHKPWHGWFYEVTLKMLEPGEGAEIAPYPVLSMPELEPLDAQGIIDYAHKHFDTLKPHFRCPLCWPLHKGKALGMPHYTSKGALKIYYCKCDACGTKFQSRVETHYVLRDQSIYK
jgi:hypothetical protein